MPTILQSDLFFDIFLFRILCEMISYSWTDSHTLDWTEKRKRTSSSWKDYSQNYPPKNVNLHLLGQKGAHGPQGGPNSALGQGARSQHGPRVTSPRSSLYLYFQGSEWILTQDQGILPSQGLLPPHSHAATQAAEEFGTNNLLQHRK